MVSQQSVMTELKEDFVSSLKSMQEEEEKTINIKTNSDLISARNFIGDYQQEASDEAIKLVTNVITKSFDTTKDIIKRRFKINQHDDNSESSDKMVDDADGNFSEPENNDDISSISSIPSEDSSRSKGSGRTNDSNRTNGSKGSNRSSAFSSLRQKIFGSKPEKPKNFDDVIVSNPNVGAVTAGAAVRRAVNNTIKRGRTSSRKKTDDTSKHDKLLSGISSIISLNATETLDNIPKTIKELANRTIDSSADKTTTFELNSKDIINLSIFVVNKKEMEDTIMTTATDAMDEIIIEIEKNTQLNAENIRNMVDTYKVKQDKKPFMQIKNFYDYIKKLEKIYSFVFLVIGIIYDKKSMAINKTENAGSKEPPNNKIIIDITKYHLNKVLQEKINEICMQEMKELNTHNMIIQYYKDYIQTLAMIRSIIISNDKNFNQNFTDTLNKLLHEWDSLYIYLIKKYTEIISNKNLFPYLLN